MKRLWSLLLSAACLTLPPQGQAANELDSRWPLLGRYCGGCHNPVDWAGQVDFDGSQPAKVASEAEMWERAVRVLRGRMMPPPGEERPDATSTDAFVAALEQHLDRAATVAPNPGSVPLHRLNRTEYARAVDDILGVKVDATTLLPRDDKSNGFDNVAEVLKVSPTFIQQYLSAARQVSIAAVGNAQAHPQSAVYAGGTQAQQYMHVDGLPLGTRGGVLFEHDFPADGEYEFNVIGLAGATYVWGVLDANTVILTIDDDKVFEGHLGGAADLEAVDLKQASAVTEINNRFRNIKRRVTAGVHRIGVTFLAKSAAESNELLNGFVPVTGMGAWVDGNSAGPRIARVEVRGPLQAHGVGETAARRQLFVCHPRNASEEPACARRILARVASAAYRRTATDEDLAGPLSFYRGGRAQGGFDAGIQKGLMAILASPKFLYRAQRPAAGETATGTYRIGDGDLASRLSFFLWSAPPDAPLRVLARSGRLHQPAVLEAQVRRMLQDPRAHTLVTNFAFQWLNVHGMQLVNIDTTLYPQFTPDLIDAFARELELFVGDVFDHDRSVLELLTSDRTFVNERLALHYGIRDVRGGQFREVRVQDSFRRGLLGKGAVLLTTSYANRTSVVLRGAYVLDKFLGTPPGAPPANVDPFPETKDGGVALTVRERMEMHRRSPACNACHAIIDPLGLALENLDADGRWRDKDRDAGAAIDATGSLVDGTAINGVDGLRAALVQRSGQFAQTFTENLMTFALGRALQYYDMPAVRAIVRDAARDQYRLSSLVLGIVRSDAFQKERAPVPGNGKPGALATTTAMAGSGH